MLMPTSSSQKRSIVRVPTHSSGFGATVAVLLLAFGAMALSLVSIAAAEAYSDSVMTRELRIQSGLNLEACLDVAEIISNKDYFAHDYIGVRELGCDLDFNSSSSNNLSVFATSTLSGVSAYGFRNIR